MGINSLFQPDGRNHFDSQSSTAQTTDFGIDFDADDGIPELTSDMLGVDTTHLDGSKVKIEELVGEKIIIFGMKLTVSKFTDDDGVHNPLAIIQLCYANDESRTHHLLFTEADAIVQFVQNFKASGKYKYPFKTKVVKNGYSYSFK